MGAGVLYWCDRQLGHLARLFALAGSLGIIALLGITATAVIWRYGFNAPIYGIEDLSTVTLSIVAAGAVAYGARRDAHVSIDIIKGLVGPRLLWVTDAVMRTLTAGIAFLAAYALVVKACGISRGCITANLGIEHRPFYYVLATALAFIGLHMTLQLLIGLVRRRDPIEARD